MILSANPKEDLNLDREIRELRRVIDLADEKQQFEIIDVSAAQPKDLQEQLLKHKPQIVHFCGHGNGEQGLMFDNGQGGQLIDTEAFSNLLKLISNNIEPIQCVLLNACYSEVQARTLINDIDYVIGMKQEIEDKAAIAFSTGFYLALGHELGIDVSYEFGCNAIQLLCGSNLTEKPRKLGKVDNNDIVIIPEHLKPLLITRQTTLPIHTSVTLKKEDEIHGNLNKILEQQNIINSTTNPPEVPSEKSHFSAACEEIPNFLHRLLDDFFNKASLKWSLCFTGEDESSKLGELTANLKSGFSETGNGKSVPSSFSYWGIVSTLTWKEACADELYPVMKEGISSFRHRWLKIANQEITNQKYHYVSLGVGLGEKDNDILSYLYHRNNSIRYFPVDMSSTMLRLGVQNATKNIPLKGSHVLPIQIDFSLTRNIEEVSKLLEQIDNNDNKLFSLVGNTLANFPEDTKLLSNIIKLMKDGDKLLIEVATTKSLEKNAVEAAAREYESSSSFRKFVSSTLLQYTNLPIDDYENIYFESSIEPDEKAIFIKIIYRNLGDDIMVRLPSWENIRFKKGDTIRLYTTRKYTLSGIDKVISDCKLIPISRSNSFIGRYGDNEYGFGIDLILLAKGHN
ncbi:L-histidine N(alpha)-methyltransferase [Microcoleus sp. herbarium2]|uniref:L-histidine N(alpha)-methyltransferase n=1 Tax=Microcoleus sp. herbarium2 TaxID=3055433 RepID=UPI002FD3DFF0